MFSFGKVIRPHWKISLAGFCKTGLHLYVTEKYAKASTNATLHCRERTSSANPYCPPAGSDQIPAWNDGQLWPSEQAKKTPFTLVQMGPTGRFNANNSSFFGPSCPAPERARADNDGSQGCSNVGDNRGLVIAATLSVLSLLHIEDLFEFIVVHRVQPFAIHHLTTESSREWP